MSAGSPFDVVVIGAGVIGASIGYHLARAGSRVMITDPGAPVFPSASWASAGGVRRQDRDPREWELTLAASKRWPVLEEELGADCAFRSGGHLHVAETESELARLAERVPRERAAGLGTELVDGAGAREIAPILASTVLGGTFTKGDGQADPRLTTLAFRDAAVRSGALYRPHAVDGFILSAGRVRGVRFGAEEVRANHVVVAAGSWCPRLLSDLGVDLPIRVEGLQMLRTDPVAPVLAPTVGCEGRPISFKQLPAGAFYIGGGWPADVDLAAHTCRLRDDSCAGSWETACELFPVLRHRRIDDRLCGLESVSRDGVSLVGPVPGIEGAYVAAGFSGHGFQLAPALGAAVAEDLTGRAPSALEGLRPSRFEARSAS